MDVRLVAAIFIGRLMGGCLGDETAAEGPQGPETAPTTFPRHTSLYVNGTLPVSAFVCAAICAGVGALQESRLELANTTVTRVDYQVVWNDAPPICQHLRFQIYYEQETSWGGIGRQLVFMAGPSPLTGQFGDRALPLNDTLSLTVIVGARENPSAAPAFVFLGTEVGYSIRVDLEHREIQPTDGDWLQQAPEDAGPTLVPTPYIPVCA